MKSFVLRYLFGVALIMAVIVACQRQETAATDTAPSAVNVDATPTTATTSTAEKTYTMDGKIVSRDAAKNQVTIENETVSGVMAAMVMAYELRGMKVDELPPDGSRITSTLHQQNGKNWVTDVKPVR